MADEKRLAARFEQRKRQRAPFDHQLGTHIVSPPGVCGPLQCEHTQIHEQAGTLEAAAEASGVAVQTHEASAVTEAAAEAVGDATQIHEQTATTEAAAEATGAVSVSGAVELVAVLEAAVEVTGTASVAGVVLLTGTLEAVAETTGVAVQVHAAAGIIEAGAEAMATRQTHGAFGQLLEVLSHWYPPTPSGPGS